MKRKIADYFYKFINGRLFIHDLDRGNISLTNSIESVLKEIEEDEKISLKGKEIIQIDSSGDYCKVIWDGSEVQWRSLPAELIMEYKSLFK